jgi:hypothetical protein
MLITLFRHVGAHLCVRPYRCVRPFDWGEHVGSPLHAMIAGRFVCRQIPRLRCAPLGMTALFERVGGGFETRPYHRSSMRHVCRLSHFNTPKKRSISFPKKIYIFS